MLRVDHIAEIFGSWMWNQNIINVFWRHVKHIGWEIYWCATGCGFEFRTEQIFIWPKYCCFGSFYVSEFTHDTGFIPGEATMLFFKVLGYSYLLKNDDSRVRAFSIQVHLNFLVVFSYIFGHLQILIVFNFVVSTYTRTTNTLRFLLSKIRNE